MIKRRGKIVRTPESQSEFVAVIKFNSLCRFLKGNAGTKKQRLLFGKFRFHVTVNQGKENSFEICQRFKILLCQDEFPCRMCG